MRYLQVPAAAACHCCYPACGLGQQKTWHSLTADPATHPELQLMLGPHTSLLLLVLHASTAPSQIPRAPNPGAVTHTWAKPSARQAPPDAWPWYAMLDWGSSFRA